MPITFHLEQNPILSENREHWYSACRSVAADLADKVPDYYRSRTFSGILGDIKALTSKKALSLISRKKGLGTQYARLYLEQGIDNGRGYQACAASALFGLLHAKNISIPSPVLDIGCSVGVTAGIFRPDHTVGLDLFADLLMAAKQLDRINNPHNSYIVGDMTKTWPFSPHSFHSVTCGLVCHHLTAQKDCVKFFSEANRVLGNNDLLVITLPSGSIDSPSSLCIVMKSLESFGFSCDATSCGLCASIDSKHSLFWMFTIIARKISDSDTDVFVNQDFGFHSVRTPVTRVQKGDKARGTVTQKRSVTHQSFVFYSLDDLFQDNPETILVYENVRRLASIFH